MIFRKLPLAGAFLIELAPIGDERGFFARAWCRRELEEKGLETAIAQMNLSHNQSRGTLRGLHFQAPPHEEVKVVRVVRGEIWDVIVDLRPDSPTHLRHAAVILSAENRHALYVPRGVAHGFLTLADETEILYQISEFYKPEAARGYRFDDPTFAIPWPEPPTVISERDRTLPFYAPGNAPRGNASRGNTHGR